MCVDHGLLKLLSFCKPDYPMPSVVYEATQYSGIGVIFFPLSLTQVLKQFNSFQFKEIILALRNSMIRTRLHQSLSKLAHYYSYSVYGDLADLAMVSHGLAQQKLGTSVTNGFACGLVLGKLQSLRRSLKSWDSSSSQACSEGSTFGPGLQGEN